MPNQQNPQQSVFMQGVEQPESGPFMEMLQQPAPQRMPRPHAQQGKAATAIMLGTQFLEGATRGRIEQYAKVEMEKQAKRAGFSHQVSAMLASADLTPEAKDAILQEAMKTIGAGVHKEAQPAAKKNPVFGVVAKIAESMTGGKMPTGAKDIGDPDAIIGKMRRTYFDKDGSPLPQFSKTQQFNAKFNQFQEAVKSVGEPSNTPREVAEAKVAPLLSELRRIDPARVQDAEAMLNQFPPGPTNAQGVAYWELKKRGLASGGAPPPGAPSESSASGSAQAPLSQNPDETTIAPAPSRNGTVASPSVSAPPGAPEQAYDPALYQLYAMAGYPSGMSQPKAIKITDPNGRELRTIGQLVQYPGFTGWIDASGKKIAGNVEMVSSAAPRVDPLGTTHEMPLTRDTQLADGTILKKGTPALFVLERGADGTAVPRVVGPAMPKPAKGGRSPSLKAERDAAKDKALSKVLQYAPPAKGGDVQAYYKYILENYKKFYESDPEVKDHFGFIDKALVGLMSGKSIQSKPSALSVLEASGGASKEKQGKHSEQGKPPEQKAQDRAKSLASELAPLTGLMPTDSGMPGEIDIPTTKQK